MLVTNNYKEGAILIPEVGARFIPFFDQKIQK
jgi:hypothetical protein